MVLLLCKSMLFSCQFTFQYYVQGGTPCIIHQLNFVSSLELLSSELNFGIDVIISLNDDLKTFSSVLGLILKQCLCMNY